MKSEEQTSSGREPVAIVGIGCRYPGVRGADELWELLMLERDVITEAPKDRFDIDRVYDPRSGTRGKLAQRGGGFLEGVLDFDPEYFHISPREAAVLDPQQRLLLEVAAEAFDDAWLGKEELARHTTGVYVGCWTSDWESHEYADPSRSDIYSMNGSIRCMLSGRISYAFDLRGPSMTLDTGCSAALLGVHLACQSLWLGESTLALASGVNLVLDSKYGITFSQGGMLAADSRCKAFDASGDGFVRSDGCAALVLMPLSAAQARGARIYGLIRGTGASNDGFSNGLLATPSEIGQQLAMRAAYRSAQLTAADVQYVEAHGTGTRAGDPVELRALSAIMKDSVRSEPCWVGSVKTNLGHTEAVAGISGMIKTLMALSHRTIPRSLHARQLTPAFEWEGSGLRVATERQSWPDVPVARAGVSSFGLSGTDVHVLLEEAPRLAGVGAARPCRDQLLLLSAAGEPALHELARAHRSRLSQETDLYALCRSAALGRHHHEQRLSVVASDALQLSEALAAFEAGEPHEAIAAVSSVRNAPQPVFVFSGQGSQCDAMARELFESDPVFRSALSACDRALSRHASWTLLDKLLSSETRWSEQPIDVIQPAIFAVQVALARMLEALEIRPAMIVGHSMGEVAAAHIAGAITLDDAALIIVTRSQNLQAIAGRGGMLSVELSFAEAEAAIAQYRQTVGVAASNSAQATVLAGDCAALASIASMLRARGVFCREVAVDAAAHSPQLDPLLPEFARKLQGVVAHSGNGTPVFSTVTAQRLPASAFDAAYWVRNQREPVRFNEAIEALIQAGHRVFVEIAPHPILLGPIQQTLSARHAEGDTVALQRRAEPQRRELLRGLGRLHALGQGMSLPQLFSEPAPFVPLPRYPFQRERCGEWPPRAAAATGSEHVSAPLRSALHPHSHVWEVELGSAPFAYLRDHTVGGEVVPPGAFYADLALLALQRCMPEHSWSLEDVKFVKALTLPDAQPTRLQITLEALQPGRVAVGFYTAGQGARAFELHASAHGRSSNAPEQPLTAASPSEISARCDARPPAQYVQRCAERTIGYGPAFQCFRGLWLGPSEALAQIELPDVVPLESAAHSVHPVLLDAGLQAGLAWAVHNRPAGAAYVPVAIERLSVQRTPGAKLWAHARVRPESDAQLVVCDVSLCEPDGTVAALVSGLALRRLEQQRDAIDEALYALRWQEREAALRPRTLTDQTWLVLADRTYGVASQLKRALEQQGARVSLISADEAVTTHVRKAASDPRRPLCGVVSLRALDGKDPFTRGEAAIADMIELGPLVLTELTQAVAGSGATALWVVTAGAQRVDASDLVAVEQAPVWALARSVRSEFPKLKVHALDLSAQVAQVEVAQLIHEITHADPGEQVAVRGSQRHVLQLVLEAPARRVKPAQPSAEIAYRLVREPAAETSALQAVSRPTPAPRQVEIEVSAAALSSSDALLLRESFGCACVGIVSAVGAEVTGVRAGQRVLALAAPSAARYVLAHAALTVALPGSLGFADALSAAAAFVPAHYALFTLGRLSPGETLFIHNAGDALSMAALQLALRQEVKLIVSALSAERRAWLSRHTPHVLDATAGDLAHQLRAISDGADVVLSLPSAGGVQLSAEVLCDHGRFVQLDPRGFNQAAAHSDSERGLTVAHFDVQRFLQAKPERLGASLKQLTQELAQGRLQPLPSTVFPLAQAERALLHAADPKQLGQVVLSEITPHDQHQPLPISLGESSPLCRRTGTYLVTGGLGALGMLVAEHLVAQGARHLVLLGRGQAKPAVAERLCQLRERGIDVRVVACDVSQRKQLDDVFAVIERDMPALRGVVHAAGVLDDGVTMQLTAERFERVMAPKVLGAFHLHQLTLKHALDFFVLFSSAASVLGNPGQGNYASANEFLDALAQRRRAQGLPALSINWGPWHEAGLAATPDRAERLASRGLGSLSDAAGVATLDRLLRSDAIQVVVLPDASFQTWKHWYPGTASMLETLLGQAGELATSAAADGEVSRVAALAKLPEHERLQAVEQYLVDVTRRVLRISPTKSLARDQSLNRLGLDSLMAVELKNRIDADLSVTLPVSKILLCSGLCHLASEVSRQIDCVSEPEIATDLDLYSEVDSAELFDDLDEPAQHYPAQKNILFG